jgi:hypothetical protein
MAGQGATHYAIETRDAHSRPGVIVIRPAL